jgi:hypothetical protein
MEAVGAGPFLLFAFCFLLCVLVSVSPDPAFVSVY